MTIEIPDESQKKLDRVVKIVRRAFPNSPGLVESMYLLGYKDGALPVTGEKEGNKTRKGEDK